jgi:hypothetical protein
MIHSLNWQSPRKPRRTAKPDPERTTPGLLARIALLEHQKKVLMARVAELEEAQADIMPVDPVESFALDFGEHDFPGAHEAKPNGQHFITKNQRKI